MVVEQPVATVARAAHDGRVAGRAAGVHALIVYVRVPTASGGHHGPGCLPLGNFASERRLLDQIAATRWARAWPAAGKSGPHRFSFHKTRPDPSSRMDTCWHCRTSWPERTCVSQTAAARQDEVTQANRRNIMSVFTLYFCGTDCWPDEGIVSRENAGGSDPGIYGDISGYIPAKMYAEQRETREQLKAIIPGPGAPWYHHWNELLVPCTIKTMGGARRDTVTGESMWDLAGHAAASIVGIRSLGRGKHRTGDPSLDIIANQVKILIGADINPQDADKPPSHFCYHFDPNLLDKLQSDMENGQAPAGPVTTINAIGHSRGGVAAIMAAHELEYMFPGAEVNIFAIDPVPGTGGLSKEMVTLARNVKNYVGVYAIDETSAGFNGVVPRLVYQGKDIDPLEHTKEPGSRINIPKYHLIYAPGRHGTVAGNGTLDGKGNPGKQDDRIAAVGTLVSRLAAACLRAWGTDVPNACFPEVDIDLHKQQMATNAQTYRNMRNYTYTEDYHSPQHWNERGVASSEGWNPGGWEYLEDSIGKAPLVERESWIPNILGRPHPGKVLWQAIEEIPSEVFSSGVWDID